MKKIHKLLLYVVIAFQFLDIKAQNVLDSLGRKQGRWIYDAPYDSLLQIKPFIIANFLNDTLQGKYEKYDDNEILRYEVNMVNGKPFGLCKWYNSKKELIAILQYQDGALTSVTKFWSKGKIDEIIEFDKTGDRTGVNILFYKNGTPWIKQTYMSGKLHGETTYYYKNGNKKTIYYYENDVINKYININRKGKVISESK